MQRQSRYVWPAVAITLLLGLIMLEITGVFSTASSLESYRLSTFNHPLFRSAHSDEIDLDYLPPDAYHAAGNLVFDPSKPLEADWVPLDRSFPPPVNWLRVVKAAISGGSDEALPVANKASEDSDLPSKVFAAEGERQSSHTFKWNLKNHGAKSRHGHYHHKLPVAARPISPQSLLEPFRKTTVLIIGDSVDRNGLKYLAENLGSGINIAQWDKAYDTEHWKYLDNGVDPAYLPHQLTLPQPVDALVTNCFLFGFDDSRTLLAPNKPDTEVDRAEYRIERLCKPYTDQLVHPVSAISLQSGLWDLAYFGRRSVAANISTSTPLTEQDQQWWLMRMETLYATVQNSWPGVPVVMRKMQRASAAGAEARYWHKNPGATQGFQNFFSDIRVHQIRNLQEYSAQQKGLEIHDFGLHFEGYQEGYSDDVHPKNIPGGVVHNKAFLHYMHRALLSRKRTGVQH